MSNIARSLIKDRAGSALLMLLLMGSLVLEFGSLEILHLEPYASDANITSACDALWYVIVTISTVGYGDRFPVTNDGRLMGTFIIVVGVGIFGTFTGYSANLSLSPSKPPTDTEAPPAAVDAPSKVSQLRRLMAQQQAAMDENRPRPPIRVNMKTHDRDAEWEDAETRRQGCRGSARGPLRRRAPRSRKRIE